MISPKFRGLLLALALGLALAPTAVSAADDTTTGILAGLGLTAASGKTTLGDSAGAIEAGLLGSQAFQHAGTIIAGVVNGIAGSRTVILLAHDEKVDLVMPTILSDRIADVTRYVDVGCANLPQSPSASALATGRERAQLWSKLFGEKKPQVEAADLLGATTVDTTIGGIALTADDRLLISSILMHANQPAIASPGDWTAWTPQGGTLAAAHYRIPADAMAILPQGSVYPAYRRLLETVDRWRPKCGGDAGKAIIGVGDSLIASLNTAEGGIAPLATAIQMETLNRGSPLVLRVAIEQVGGTSITRSGVIYTFGWPDAATVGSGLLASFRLIDPAEGTSKAIGFVRCMVRQTNIKRVADVLAHTPPRHPENRARADGEVVCDYRVSA